MSISGLAGNASLQHIGFSYGTFLGATFASTFSDHVKMVVLDDVLDAERSTSGYVQYYLQGTTYQQSPAVIQRALLQYWYRLPVVQSKADPRYRRRY